MKLKRVFIGSDGLRAGWSFLLFLLILAAFAGLVFLVTWAAIGRPKPPKGEIPAGLMLLREPVSAGLILAATAIMAWIERRPLAAFGYGARRAVPLFVAGLAGGFVSLSALVLLLDAAGFETIALSLRGAGPAIAYALVWLLIFALVGVSEEALFRGYPLATLARGMGFWPAALVMGLLFGAVHASNGGETLLGLGQVVVAALAFTVLLRVTGSLWASIGFHAAWDWSQSYLWGTPDSGLLMRGHLLTTKALGAAWISGGVTGPEGSALALPAFAFGGLISIALVRGLTRPRMLPAKI